MTVCITGDVHHMSMETRDQAYMDRTEVEAALEYAEIASSYEVPVTLFVTGKAVSEEPERIERLAARDGVELGGHNYYAFDTLVHKASKGLLGTWHGPRRLQRWEIEKTISTFAERGVHISAWRGHAYRHDRNTRELLSRAGLTHVSDAVGPDERVRRLDGMTVVPINTPPDHEHVYHAFRTAEFVEQSDFEGPFGNESCPVDDWLDWVLAKLDSHAQTGTTATVLAHPACMALADGLEAFERLCDCVSETHRTAPVSDVSAG